MSEPSFRAQKRRIHYGISIAYITEYQSDYLPQHMKEDLSVKMKLIECNNLYLDHKTAKSSTTLLERDYSIVAVGQFV